MNNIRNVESINEQELNAGIIGGLSKGSWHEEYKESAWVFFGGFPYELSEGDIICVMSQWGEIEDINLVRDKATNKSKGFAFVKYEDNRSTILAVDNFNGMKLLGRTLRCDHVQEYRLPKEVREKEMEALEDNPDGHVEIGPGHAYKHIELATVRTGTTEMEIEISMTEIGATAEKRATFGAIDTPAPKGNEASPEIAREAVTAIDMTSEIAPTAGGRTDQIVLALLRYLSLQRLQAVMCPLV
jgi:RNA-binding motif X-linked protein 2